MIRFPLRLVATALLLAGCASAARLMPSSLPPIATSNARLPGKIVWRDLVTADLAAAERFYGGVFGWQFEKAADGYVLARNGERLVGGIAEVKSADAGSQWVTQIAVSDVEQAATAAQRGGATILLGPLAVPGRGEVVVVRDPLGAVFGMIHTSAGDPPDIPPRDNDWLWSELWVSNPQKAASFYFPLFNYTPGTQVVNGRQYTYFKSAGLARGGLVPKPDAALGNAWVSYVRVANVDATVALATQFGGRVLMAPTPEVRAGKVAILGDPGGAGVLVQEWPMRGES